jgi:two-component system response regulator YesN
MTYRILIVDDESFATDWISHKISEVFQDDVDVYKSSEANAALNKLLTGVYDIAILDINMPGITGLEMLEEIEKKGIETLVIFLTAHSEFEYAQKAISQQVVSYILKGDSDDLLIDAIKTAMERIEQQAQTNNLLKIAQSRLHVAAPTIKREYIIKLLQDLSGLSEEAHTIPLYIDGKKPVAMLLCSPNTDASIKDNTGLLFEISNYIEGILGRDFVYEGAMPEKGSFVWILQPKADRYEEVIPMLLSVIENAQTYFYRHTGKNLMFVYYSKCFPFHEIGKIYGLLSYIQGYGSGTNHIVLTEESLRESDEREGHAVPGEEYESFSQLAPILQRLLEHGEKEECLKVLHKICAIFSANKRKNDTIAMEAFMYISAVAFSYLNKISNFTVINEEFSVSWLGKPEAFASWDEVPGALENLFQQFFALQTKKKDNRSLNCINKAREYIHNNLDKDLSLIMLAEMVFLNPSYFSILFKNKVGCNVSEYIKYERLKKAKQQLAETKLKINEIARNVGYPNAAYFGKFIKNETGMTPLEYRDSCNP